MDNLGRTSHTAPAPAPAPGPGPASAPAPAPASGNEVAPEGTVTALTDVKSQLPESQQSTVPQKKLKRV